MKFPHQIGEIISTPDLIGGVTGILVEVEELKVREKHLHEFRGELSNIRTHRIKLAILHTEDNSWQAGEIADFWPPLGASWKKL